MALSELEKYYLEQLKKEGKEPEIHWMFGEELVHYYEVISGYKKLEFDDLMDECTRNRLFVRVKSKEEAKKMVYIAKKANYTPSKYDKDMNSISLKYLMVYFDKKEKTYSVESIGSAYTVICPAVVYFKDLVKFIGYMLDDYK